MQIPSVAEIQELAQLVAEIRPTFEVRRFYARIEAGEITVRDACDLFAGEAVGPSCLSSLSCA